MAGNRISDMVGSTPQPELYASQLEREGSRLRAVSNAYMLDTSIGQGVMMAATANAFGVRMNPMYRRVQEGYSPFDKTQEDLSGFSYYLDEFSHSTSPEETAMIKQQIENNLDLRRDLEGWGGTRLLTSFLDPVNLIPVPFALGKGFAKGAAEALKVGIPIVGTTEVARHLLDRTSTVEETIFNTLGGGLFMGIIGGGIGMIPKNTMSVSAALNKLIPPPGTTSMSLGVPWSAGGSAKSAFKRVTALFKSEASSGGPSWKKVDPADVKVTRVDDGLDGTDSPSNIIQVHYKDELVLEAAIRGGNELQIFDVRVPENLRQQGIGSYAIRQAIQFAEENGLRVTSDTQVSALALKMWKGFEDQGFNIKENQNFEVDINGTRDSTDARPLFEMNRLLEAEANKIPLETRELLEDLRKAAELSEADLKTLQKSVKELKQRVKDAPTAGGAKTKAKNKLKDMLDEENKAYHDWVRTKTNYTDANVKAIEMLDQKTIKDWDLLPTGYNKILGKLDQFPWWKLIKTPLRNTHPEVAVKLQMFALKMAATPGLNNKGNVLANTTGPSVESLVIEYTGRWLAATRNAQRIYRAYTGHGEASGQIKHFVIDQQQRVRGAIDRAQGKQTPTTTADNKLTVAEFENQISVAISKAGKHQVPEIAEAAKMYMAVLKDIGEEAKLQGVFATQKNIARRIGKIDQQLAEFDAKWGDKYQIGDLDAQTARFQELNKELKALDDSSSQRRAEIEAELDRFYAEDRKPLPPGLENRRTSLQLERMEQVEALQSYKDADNPSFIHRMWIAESVIANEVKLKQILTREFEANPKYPKRDQDGVLLAQDPDLLRARVNEAYHSILHDAETGNNGAYAPDSTNKRPWLEARKAAIEDGTFVDANGPLSPKTAAEMIRIIDKKLKRIRDGETITGASGPLIARRLDLDDSELLDLGLIEGNVNIWMNHYVSRTAPMIETARMFGDARAQTHIDALHDEIYKLALDETDPKKQAALFKEADEAYTAMNDLRDIVHGTYGIPDDPDALTGRILRMMRNFNILGAMGRSVFMALGDIGNVVMSQGLKRSLGYAFETFGSSLTDGKIKMIRQEVDLAGSVSEVILGMRYHQMTDFGIAVGSSKYPGMAKFERGLANMSQRFFLYNLLGPWTDMARRFSGGMLQSRLIENSIQWKAGTLSDDEITIMGRLGISKERAIQFADEWEGSGQNKHGEMFIASTGDWNSRDAVRVFRAAMNTEINRMVPTPGAVDKPKALLKGEWWKVIGQYRGFSIAATHRILGAGIHQKGAQKYSGFASMVGIAMMVDAMKRPDYIQLPLEEQILRAVELSGVTGIVLDLNDSIERASAGSMGLRPMMGMDIRERNPNWANRMGTIGAVPNSWLTLMYGLTSDEAQTDDLAKAIRYMIPYNNLLWTNEIANRIQRSSVDMLEETEE